MPRAAVPPHERVKARLREDAATGCWLWTGCVDRFGYGKVSIPGGGFDRTHRVMYAAYVGAVPEGMCLMHACDVPRCCNPAHLSLGTKAENNADKALKDRAQRKLSAADAAAIRGAAGTHKAIASRFGVSRTMVTHIKNGTERKYV